MGGDGALAVGALREQGRDENRVALTPDGAARLIAAGHPVWVEQGAGKRAWYPDDEYTAAGAQVAHRATLLDACGVVACVQPPPLTHALREGQVLVGLLQPLLDPQGMKRLADAGVTAVSFDTLPRTVSRAQSMDALTSQASVAGYKAAVLAADTYGGFFPMLTTAAGTTKPATVLVLGAGVAGLQAIATARRLGAKVEAYDVRPAAKEQVLSLGARFAELPLETTGAEDTGGYAVAQDEAFYRRQREMMLKWVSGSDIVITTAAVPGRKSPVLITADMVAAMPPGSIIVDLAAERGGNCELTRADDTVAAHGVTIFGPTNLPGTVPHDASQMYARNITTFLLHLARREKGDESPARVRFEIDDEITRETLVTRDGAVVHARIA